MTEADMRTENIAALGPAQLDALCRLEVSERQAFHGKSFPESIEDWRNTPPDLVLGLCFLAEDRPVGLTLFNRPDPEATVATIHGLKIATPWQGRGWGHVALRVAVARLGFDWPKIRTLRLAVDADNVAAIAIYRRFGMTDSGPVDGSRGPEHHMSLSLTC